MNYLYFSGATQQDLKTLEDELAAIDEQLTNAQSLKKEDVTNLLAERQVVVDAIAELKNASIPDKTKDYLTSPRGLISTGLRAFAVGVAYSRTKSIWRAGLINFVWLPYLMYVGYDKYLKDK